MKTDEIREVLEELLKSASGINPEWSSTQERITKTLSKLSALYKIDEGKIEKIIHRTRHWQSLHLEVIPEILEDVKKGLAKAIAEGDIF